MLNIPEQAVACFEKWSSTTVTVYDFEPIFYLSDMPRSMHLCRECSLVKKACLRKCVDFDYVGYRARKWDYPDGCLKICHAGFLEWVMPVHYKERMLAVLMAGIRLAPDSVPAGFPHYISKEKRLDNVFPELKKTDEEEILHVMEGLRQLAARLSQWFGTVQNDPELHTTLKRDEQILFLIRRHSRGNMSLAELAKYLHLSPSRAAHLVKETTGKSFKALVSEYRLERAAKLLLYSGETVTQIAGACGYDNVSHFHRAFKDRFNTSPLKYRRQSTV